MRRIPVAGWLAPLFFGFALGCPSEGPGTSSDEGDESGETGPVDDYDAPVFIDPASGVVSLGHDQLVDPVLRVADVVAGRTQLEIDGRLVGTLQDPGPIGHMEGEHLRLRADGAMLRGTHNMRLVTPGTTAQQTSADIEVRIISASLPKLSYELGADVVAGGVHAIATGTGERGLLLLLEPDGAQQATLSIVPASGATWNANDLRTLPLPGYVVDSGDPHAAVSAALVLDDDAALEDPIPRVRVAWRVGMPGNRVDAVELEWGADGNTADETQTVLAASDVPDAEWVEVVRPAFIRGDVAIEVHAPVDTEQPLPGDDTLWLSRWPDAGTPGPPARATFGMAADLDLLGPVVDLARDDNELGLRVAGARLQVMRWEPGAALPQLAGPEPSVELSDQSGDALGMAVVLGAFGSQTTAIVRTDGAVRVVLHDAAAHRGRTAYPPPDDLPNAIPSGPPAVSVALGSPVFLVPYANAGEVAALLVDGDATQVQILAGLFCDEVALPAAPEGAEKGTMSFACVQDGEVRLGALFANKG